MKIGLLSDIHANSDALYAVLSDAQSLGVKSFIIAGDFVGYYYNIEKVLSSLSSLDFIAIGGNHEAMLSDWCLNKNHNLIQKKYGSSIGLAYKALSGEQKNGL